MIPIDCKITNFSLCLYIVPPYYMIISDVIIVHSWVYSQLLNLQIITHFDLHFFCMEIESQSHPIIYNTLYEGMTK